MNVVSGANLREEFEITALFHIPKKYPCSYAFAQMEQAKKELLIDDYSITQTSLEQVRTAVTISGILFFRSYHSYYSSSSVFTHRSCVRSDVFSRLTVMTSLPMCDNIIIIATLLNRRHYNLPLIS